MEKLLTVTGRPMTITTSTRLEPPIYKFIAEQAAAKGESISTYLRQIILEKIGPELPPSAGAASGG